MSHVAAGSSALYVTTSFPAGGGVHQSNSVVQPGGTLVTDGEATINIQKFVDSANLGDNVHWEAALTRPGQKGLGTPLQSLGNSAISPGQFGNHPGGAIVASKLMEATQAFKLPFVPGDSHLTMVAKNAAGKVLASESFKVQGTMAITPRSVGESS